MRLSVFLAVACLTPFTAALVADESAQLDSEADRVSYSLGHQVGSDLQRQALELDEAAIRQGLEDGLAGTEPRVPNEEMRALLMNLKGRIVEDEQERRLKKLQTQREKSEQKRKAGQAFLTSNAKKPDVRQLPSGLQYKIIQASERKKPSKADRVTVHYRGTLIDGREFDSSYADGEPVTFQVGGVISGWTEALQLMGEGAKWQLFIPPELGYGRRGPLADETLVFEVELLTVGDDTKAPEPMPESKKSNPD